MYPVLSLLLHMVIHISKFPIANCYYIHVQDGSQHIGINRKRSKKCTIAWILEYYIGSHDQ